MRSSGGDEHASPAISLAIVNARVRTGDPRRPWADAVAVAGDRIVAVGSSAEVRKLAGAGARVVDARGGSVAAGDGSALARGMPADFVVLDRDISREVPGSAPDSLVRVTVAGGRVVHEEESRDR